MTHPAYRETLDFLYRQLPMFQRVGTAAYKKDLTNTLALCKLAGNPHKQFKSIHIAGTNGKGSVSHMLAAILQEAGYKTGLYTSPHLKDFRERIRINGQMISEADVVAFTERTKNQLNAIQPSFFEWTVAMAFDYFAREKVDIAVVEVGLGGRLDSTNVITPELSVITNIGWDHMDMLGDTLPKIAAEKAGIIKADVPVVVGQWQDEVAPVFERIANEKRALLKYADQKFQVRQLAYQSAGALYEVKSGPKVRFVSLYVDLAGHYQQFNLATVLAATEVLQRNGWELEDEHIGLALGKVRELTGFAGRWTVLGQNPMIIADTAHNSDGLHLVMEQLATLPRKSCRIILGVVNDKDLAKILPLFPKEAIYYFCKSSIPRALNEVELAQKAAQFGLLGSTYPDVKTALETAIAESSPDDLLYVGGSTFTVADII